MYGLSQSQSFTNAPSHFWHTSSFSLNVIPEERDQPSLHDGTAFEVGDSLLPTEDLYGSGFFAESLDRRSWYYNRRNIAQSQAYGMDGARAEHGGSQTNLGAPSLAVVDEPTTPQKFANFLMRHNPLKRTKSVSKLDRNHSTRQLEHTPFQPRFVGSQNNLSVSGAQNQLANQHHALHQASTSQLNTLNNQQIRPSLSHESLLSYSTTTHMIDLGTESEMRALHPSVLARPNCIQISTSSGATKYYACRTAAERDRWIECLQRTMAPNRDEQRRQENALQIWILEAKGMANKRRYFCELCFDKVLFGRTSAKPKTDMCFWGEQFEFNHMSNVQMICINLYREPDRRKKKDRCTLIGYIEIPVDQLRSKHPVERWYPVITTGSETSKSGGMWSSSRSSNQSTETASMRVKARFQSVDVLPLRAYAALLKHVERNYLCICNAVEPVLTARVKEDFVTGLIKVLHKRRVAQELLTDLVMAEVNALENNNLMFRGNSLATKAMEAYQKLVADHYLQETLGDFVRTLLDSDDDCEVDPLKLTDLRCLQRNQRTLLFNVESAWGKIVNSMHDFPSELRVVFSELRRRLGAVGRQELADNLTSASIFLRFLCPAILSPSLFGLCTEYPSDKAARNLTLIAKTMQTLANFSKFSGKENYMEFMNAFVEHEWMNMKAFLQHISSSPAHSNQRRSMYGGALDSTSPIDLGRELAILHDYLDESLNAVAPEHLVELRQVIQALNRARDDPDAAIDLLVANNNSLNGSRFSTPPTGRGDGSTVVQVQSPTSDYDNNSVTPQDGQTPRLTASLINQATPPDSGSRETLRNVNDEGLMVRSRVGDKTNRQRKDVHRQVSAADAINGRVQLSFADDTNRSSQLGANSLDISTEEELETPVRSQPGAVSMGVSNAVVAHSHSGAVSSGYHSSSHSHSSQSSSPVERMPSNMKSKSKAALSIQNPMYSSVMVGVGNGANQTVLVPNKPKKGSRAGSLSHSVPDLLAVNELTTASSALTPDSSFECCEQMSPHSSSTNSSTQERVSVHTQGSHANSTNASWMNTPSTTSPAVARTPANKQKCNNKQQQHYACSALPDSSIKPLISTSTPLNQNTNGTQLDYLMTTSLTPCSLNSLLSETNGTSIDHKQNASSPSSTLSSASSTNSQTHRQLPRTNPRMASYRASVTGSSHQRSSSRPSTTTEGPNNNANRSAPVHPPSRRTSLHTQSPAVPSNNQRGYNNPVPNRPPAVMGNSQAPPPPPMRRTNTCDVITRQPQAPYNARHTGAAGNTPYHRQQSAQRRSVNVEPRQLMHDSPHRHTQRSAAESQTQSAGRATQPQPDWQDAITPVLDRLQRLELEIQQQMNSGHDKQALIDEQQRQIANLRSANQKLNADMERMQRLCLSRESLTSSHSQNSTNTNTNTNNNNNNNMVHNLMVSTSNSPAATSLTSDTPSFTTSSVFSTLNNQHSLNNGWSQTRSSRQQLSDQSTTGGSSTYLVDNGDLVLGESYRGNALRPNRASIVVVEGST